MNYKLIFEVSEALYEAGNALEGSNQPLDSVELGPFPDFVQLTYGLVRVGPDGEHIAAWDEDMGCWTTAVREAPNMKFSDIVIVAEP